MRKHCGRSGGKRLVCAPASVRVTPLTVPVADSVWDRDGAIRYSCPVPYTVLR